MSQQLDLQLTLNNLSARLTRVEAYLSLNVVSDGEPPQIQAYDDYVNTYLPPFLDASENLGDHTTQLGGFLEKAFTAQREFLVKASRCKKPQKVIPAEFESLSKVQLHIDKVREIRDNAASSSTTKIWYTKLSNRWDGCVPTKPAVDSFVEGLDFWGNKIRVEAKTKKPDHVTFVTTLKTLLTQLSLYIKVYHLVGVTWSSNAIDTLVQNDSCLGGSILTVAKSKDIQASADVGTGSKRLQTPSKSSAKPPICEECNGNWLIEYQTGSDPLNISGIDMKQQVYIFGCEEATILLEGKAKNRLLQRNQAPFRQCGVLY